MRGAPPVPADPGRPAAPPKERPPARLRIMLAEDQTLLRTSLERLLAREPSLELIASVADLDGLVSAAERSCPDVALVDLWMPEGVPSGFRAPASLRRICPRVRLLALSGSLREADVRRAFDVGFDGYSTKEITPSLLAERVRVLAAGRRFIDPEVAHLLMEPAAGLSGTELALLQALALGHSQAGAAAQASVSERHARRVLARACAKLGADSATQAVALAVARGLVRA